jgi:hypothetical protein
MKSPFFSGARLRPALAILATSILAVPGAIAQSTWLDSNTGLQNWTNPLVWDVAPVSGASTQLIFNGIPANIYTANNDFAGTFQLNSLTLNSSAASAQTIQGNALEFTGTTPAITQSGSGAFTIGNNIALTNTVPPSIPLSLGGAGTGITTLSGVLSGTIGLSSSGGTWQLTNVLNTFTGGLTVGTGSLVELAPTPS